MTYCLTPTRMVKVKRLTISNINEDVDQMEFTYIAGSSVKVTSSEKVALSDKVKLITCPMTPISTIKYLQIAIGKLVQECLKQLYL